MPNNFYFLENRAVYEIMWKYSVEGAGHGWQYGACTLHAGYLRLQIQTQDMKYLLLVHCNNCCTKAPQCDVTHTLSVLFIMDTESVYCVVRTEPYMQFR